MAEGRTTIEDVKKLLADVKDPETGRGIDEQGQIADIQLDDGRLAVTVALTTFSAPLWEEVRADVQKRLQERFADLSDIHVELAVHSRPPQKLGQIGLTVKGVIAVASGKGGVGKSTIAASLALGLRRAGCEVGLMDADVYGPSIPHLLGVNQRPELVDQRIQPVLANGLKVMSMGFLVPPGEAVVWRGPMLHGAITQFLRDTDWGDLDYLIIDMPPGTGDIALTLSQLLPLTGAVIVCTPQDVALLDAVKAISMYRKVNIPILGVVENMSYFLCPGCEKRYDIFGSGGARRRAEELEIPFFGDVPINMQIRIRGDAGETDANFEDAVTSQPLQAICYRLAKNLSEQFKAEPPLPSLSVL